MKVILCGLGKMGNNHFRILSGFEDCKILAVVDSNEQTLATFSTQSRCPRFLSLKEALRNTTPDAVLIAASTEQHFSLAKEVLSRKIPLFLEKPITRTVKEAMELCELAVKKQVPFMVGHVERFNPAIVAAHRLIQQGVLGEIINLSFVRVGGAPKDFEGAGNVLIDLAVHDIDITQWLLGQVPQLVECIGHGKNVVDSATLLLQANGVTIDIHANWLTPIKIRELRITGSKGYLSINLISQSVVFTKENPILMAPIESKEFFFDEYLAAFSTPDRTEIGIEKKEPLKEELSCFLRCLREGHPVPVPGVEALAALRIAEEARNRLVSIFEKKRKRA